jgi:hypothetical protein
MHKLSLELLIYCASFVGVVLNASVDRLPHTYSCTCLLNKKKQRWKQTRALSVWTPRSLNHFIIIILFIIIFIIIDFFYCSPNFLSF